VAYKVESKTQLTVNGAEANFLNIVLTCDRNLTPWCNCTGTASCDITQSTVPYFVSKKSKRRIEVTYFVFFVTFDYFCNLKNFIKEIFTVWWDLYTVHLDTPLNYPISKHLPTSRSNMIFYNYVVLNILILGFYGYQGTVY
jgi:hypothetical protein